MRMILALLFLTAAVPAHADENHRIAIDSAYLDSGVYRSEKGGVNVIEVQYPGAGPCSHLTPHGATCVCNKGVIRGRPKPGFVPDQRQRYVRVGFYVTYMKGQHLSGIICHRE